MAKSNGTLRICNNGHRYYKSSTCPVCPVCENQKRPSGFMGELSAPARRALEKAGITTLGKVSKYSEGELLALHGFGPSGIRILKALLRVKGMDFKK